MPAIALLCGRLTWDLIEAQAQPAASHRMRSSRRQLRVDHLPAFDLLAQTRLAKCRPRNRPAVGERCITHSTSAVVRITMIRMCRQMLSVRVEAALVEALDATAAVRGMSRSRLVRQGLEAVVGDEAMDRAREAALFDAIRDEMEEDRRRLREATLTRWPLVLSTPPLKSMVTMDNTIGASYGEIGETRAT